MTPDIPIHKRIPFLLQLAAGQSHAQKLVLSCHRLEQSWSHPADDGQALLPKHQKLLIEQDVAGQHRFLIPLWRRQQQLATLGLWCQGPSLDMEAIGVLGELLLDQLDKLSGIQSAVVEHLKFQDGPLVMVMWEASTALPVCYLSANAATLLGMDVKAILNGEARFEDWLEGDDIKAFLRVMRAHAKGIRHSEIDYRIRDPQGGLRWVRQYTVAHLAEDKSVVAICGYLLEQTHRKQLEIQMKATRDRLALVIEASAMGVADWDIPQDQLLTNAKFRDIMGHHYDDMEPCLRAWQEQIHPLDSNLVEDRLTQHLAGQSERFLCEYRIITPDNQIRWLESYGALVEQGEQQPKRMVFMHRDITERRAQERARERQQLLLNLIHRAQSVFLVEKDLGAACESIFEPLLELAESQFGFISDVRHNPDGSPFMQVQTLSDISWDDSSRALYQKHLAQGLEFHNMETLFGRVITTGQPLISNNVRRDAHAGGTPKGHPPLDSFLGLPIQYQGRLLGLVGFANRSEGYSQAEVDFLQPLMDTLGMLMHARLVEKARRDAETELAVLASTDTLTGLNNRRAFMDALAEAITMGQPHTLVLMDLDHFKQVNDTFGHGMGDQVLGHFAELLRQHARSGDVLGRIGGEEFVWLIRGVTLADSKSILERMRQAVACQPLLAEGQAIGITVSLGATELKADDPPDAPLLRADVALYEAKKRGRNCLVAA
ncbi:sensor domain-containing diguanylate cyclase [Gallaecimonas xiamenensis]|uniref:diguanylate cyclase n=1 Tax=Gallaecimonas xiamenensis 3-C-1 TaxID=745411 RepID=K2JYH3_9GAMM|nr:sensor domain-containing diguanylate cyclase [Gallaecimonas xiamenensis]EKE75379.1 PAS/PAC and GAF sensor-containing diguanylate cyclase [Gallaecimonas xiamenensis 3-C-1]